MHRMCRFKKSRAGEPLTTRICEFLTSLLSLTYTAVWRAGHGPHRGAIWEGNMKKLMVGLAAGALVLAAGLVVTIEIADEALAYRAGGRGVAGHGAVMPSGPVVIRSGPAIIPTGPVIAPGPAYVPAAVPRVYQDETPPTPAPTPAATPPSDPPPDPPRRPRAMPPPPDDDAIP